MVFTNSALYVLGQHFKFFIPIVGTRSPRQYRRIDIAWTSNG